MTREAHACEWLKVYFDENPDAIIVVAADGEIVQANEQCTEMFGYAVDDLVGTNVDTLVPEEIRDDHPEMRDQYFAEPTSRPMGAGLDLEVECADGTTIPVDISLSPTNAHGDLEVVAAIRDISYQHSLQRKYRSLLDTAPDAAVVANVETGEILEVNEAAVDLFEATEDALVGKNQTDLHPPGEADHYRDLFSSHVDAGRVQGVSEFGGEDLHVVTATGERIPVEISASVTTVADQRVIMGIFRDISTRRAHERELEEQLERVELLSQVLAHDVRNPLNVASGRLYLAQQTGDLDHLDVVSASHDRIEEIVNDALTLIRDGFDVEYVEPLDLASVASDCWDAVDTKDATLDVSDSVTIAADRRVRHLFENLFRNSVEHGGPSVTVTVEPVDDGFVVEDDGPGIPPEDRDTIFDAGWTTNSEGTGLGLTIVHDVATAHGWEVGVLEAPGGGTRFAFTGVSTSPDDSYTPPTTD